MTTESMALVYRQHKDSSEGRAIDRLRQLYVMEMEEKFDTDDAIQLIIEGCRKAVGELRVKRDKAHTRMMKYEDEIQLILNRKP